MLVTECAAFFFTPNIGCAHLILHDVKLNFEEDLLDIKELNINEEESDEDTPGLDNPMVASFAEDVDIEEYVQDLDQDEESPSNQSKFTKKNSFRQIAISVLIS